ncbi:transglutaminase-like domain-containing protein [Actinomadura parmotrematis]|uniref:Transglutaminase family protein n=1 Tax=Actinomadura parmotrematis TaxID=2864039 RepID=A0ABS7FTC1_9ACTN|nr:transglutaminase family protein [Actinomadura parmotrematis]MBW8483648.1 transglutaminase family protein [Actinomadura parmotrematis]
MDFDADPWDYLGADEAVDLEHPLVQSTAASLRDGDDVAYARAAFEHVRDEIAHSVDARDPRVTWRASDVLEQRTGFCHAKAIAYVALLRAGGVQAGLAYQRLADGDGFVLHGLAAALIDDRWVLLDPRGDKPGIDVRFSAAEDRLAFTPDPAAGELTYPTVYASPPPAVLNPLKAATDALALAATGLPDSL